MAAGLLVREPGGVALRHGLIGEVVYARLLPAERTALHRAIAAALPAEAAAQRAEQCHRAGLRAEALAASVTAGLDAAACTRTPRRRSISSARSRCGTTGVTPGRPVELLAAAAQAARYAGDADRAVTLCREALEALDHAAQPERAARLYERLGEYTYWDDEAALACYAAGLRLRPGDPRLLAGEGHALMGLRRWAEARERCEAALAAGVGEARITLGVVLAFLGEPEAGEAHLQRALERSDSPEDTARAYVHLGEVRRVRGDHAGALAAMVAGERAAERFGLHGTFGPFMHVNAAEDLLRLGRWDEAARRLADGQRLELSRTTAAMRRATAGLLHALRGEVEAARRELDPPADADLPHEFLAPLAAARATLALAEGDAAAARTQLDGALDAVRTRSTRRRSTHWRCVPRPSWPRPPARAGERSTRVARTRSWPGSTRCSPAGRRRTLARTGHWPPPSTRGSPGRRTPSAGATRRRPGTRCRSRIPPPTPACTWPRPSCGRATGARPQAAAAAAHAAAAALGARPLRDAIRALALRARLDLAAAPARQAPDDAPGGLTSREADVLRALAEGLTNREIAARLFISQKTVSAHLAHIFAKLDVHTRVEAAGRARTLGVL